MIGREELERLYVREGKTLREIAERYGVAKQTVLYWVRKYGLERGLREARLLMWEKRKGKVEYRDPRWLWERYVVEGKSMARIAEEAGVSPRTVELWLKRYGLARSREEARAAIARTVTGKVPVWQDRGWLFREHVIEGKSAARIARELGVHPQTVRKWLRIHGIRRGK